MMRVPENILMTANVLGVGDEGDGGVGHDLCLICENIGDEADDLATLGLEVGVQLGIHSHQAHQLPQFLLIA